VGGVARRTDVCECSFVDCERTRAAHTSATTAAATAGNATATVDGSNGASRTDIPTNTFTQY
jgi:hypothetical protein